MKTIYSYNTIHHSMSGEDGIILHLIKCLQDVGCVIYNTCAEFGASDGVWLSNTKVLIDMGWESLQIEGDPDKYVELLKNHGDNPKVHCLCAYISPDVEAATNFNKFFKIWDKLGLDVLSIDVDSCDYDIFKGLEVSPSIVLVENNSHQEKYKNEGMTTITKTANEKGYSLIGYTCNSIFIKTELLPFIDIAEVTPEQAWKAYWKNSSKMARESLKSQMDTKNHWKK